MTMPLRGRRTLDVDGQTFHWTISRLGDVGYGSTVVRVELAALAGGLLTLRFASLPGKPVGIRPNDVRVVVRHALASGWDPEDPRSTPVVDTQAAPEG
ncbi:hypothetical protein [Microbacterium sp. NPDC087868]|uniref:hypothetical protein n=1 Tax=Microbacterium sp. NPDC087868 TaxID=3364195 RepID=UPI00384A575A